MKFQRLVIVAWCAVMSATLASNVLGAEADWSQWRGANRDGLIDAANWPQRLAGKLTEVWHQEFAPSYSGAVVADGLVFTTETVDKSIERVSALDLATGEIAWARQWPGAMSVPFFAAANGDWIRSTPIAVRGSLIVLGMRDVLVRMDARTGNDVWRIDFPEQFKTPLQPFGAACSPLIYEDAVFVQLGGGLTKVDFATGKVMWQVLGGGSDMTSTGAFSSPVVATIAGVPQLLVQTRFELCGVSPEDGTVLWRQPIEAFRGMNILTPLVIGDAVFTAAHSGASQLFDISHDGGRWTVTERWRQKTQGYMSSPVVLGDDIYLHLKNERAACLAVSDGTIHWTSRPVGKYWSMIHNHHQILALAENGVLRLIEGTPTEFLVIDEAKVAENSWAHLAVQDDLVIVRSLDRLSVYRWNN
ncbi:PQQ-binding-like beta-propeller repeat protein [Allorhodopirellula heiligendammensis]|uniref:Outer membrane biogenesis protein BamB n=1 Tax=Allorhodopirellula heiligendammensis TaxID=2714739 RepID=A0A5C6C547_9BACT|nr:outer membrane biogenesis protein BamB [Allorhodopirellula heiligendammensis]